MLRDITIKNYRLFREFHWDGIARVNLIVGANNSGKSSLLEALYLLRGTGWPDQQLFEILFNRGEYVSRVNTRNGLGVRIGYQLTQVIHGRRFELENPTSVDSKRDEPCSWSFVPRMHDGNPALMIMEDGAEIEQLVLADDFTFTTADPPRRPQSAGSVFVTTYYPLESDGLAALWDAIVLTPKEEKVIEALRILEPETQRISFTSGGSSILIKLVGQDTPVPLGSLGDGMRRLLALTASLVNAENGTLLVDEIDTGLHYSALTDMWRLLLETSARLNAQIFATTHSSDCVRAFQEALGMVNGDADLGRLVRLERDGEDIKPVAYGAHELTVAVQQGIEVR